MNRLPLLAVLTSIAIPLTGSTAHASDSLLSGYGGPGNGEQALLGTQLTGGGSGGGGPRGGASAGHTSLRATATAPTASSTSSAASTKSTPTLSSTPGKP